ncbi:class I SAM-dependent methyltransferase [Amycolatopsis sp. NPDC004378]
MNREIRTLDDLLRMLDDLVGTPISWDGFYEDRDRPIPFFADRPDENLDAWLREGPLDGGRALELGCGPGRNARRLAEAGYEVDAVDGSASAIAWARERAPGLRFHQTDIFAMDLPHEAYDLVCDSGCLHHLAPHRRISYLALLDRYLKPGGHFGLVCFAAGTGDANSGTELPDAQLYRDGSLHGGLAYTPAELRRLFAGYTEVELRPMAEKGGLFGVPFLLAALFRKE